MISFELTQASDVRLDVFNVMGQRVSTLVNNDMQPGHHSIEWDASNYSSGVYFAKLVSGENSTTIRMSLIK